MLRLTGVLGAGLFLALLIGGEDRGQLRPGLARAKAEGHLNLNPDPKPLAVAVAAAAPPPTPPPAAAPAAARRVAQVLRQVAPAKLLPAEPAKPVQSRVADPVFTLSGLIAAPLPEPASDAATPAPPLSGGQVWYVTARSVNVRQGPSTDAAVLDTLVRGEAITVMWQEGDDWARILIEGDGMKGFVATRFLSQTLP